MKTRIPGCVVIATAVALLAGCGLPPATARVEVNPHISDFKTETVAILPFEGVQVNKDVEEYWGWWKENIQNNGEAVSDMLATELVGVGGFNYIERSQIRKVLEEKGFSMADLVRQKTASEIGKLIGADAVVLGNVSKMHTGRNVVNVQDCSILFSARMVDSKTGVILWSASVNRREDTVAILEVARQECRSIAEQIRARLAAKTTAR